jgi:hypothetical protein
LIIGIVDAEIASIAQPIRIGAQKSGAEGVESGQLRIAASAFREHFYNSLPHLLGSLVGEGDGYNVLRPNIVFADKMNDSAGNDARFTASGACKYQQRAFLVQHCLVLLRVQARQVID